MTSRYILIVGLGKHAPTHAHTVALEEIIQKFKAEMEKVHEAGYTTRELQLNPEDVTGSVETLRTSLKETEFDALIIGYGLRGMKELTVLFEGIVNCTRVTRPEVKLLFTTRPDGVMEALERL
jgi:ubiquinone/menaquinone biosynthesis C-methylase UbiE